MEDEREIIREQNRWNPDRKEEGEKPKSSLPKSTVALMLCTALFFDGLQIVLEFVFGLGIVVDSFVSIFAIFTFSVWFKMHDISFVNPKRLAAMGGGFFIEIIPGLNALPVWTAAVWYTISTTKILETVEKLPGGKVVGFVAQSKMAATNASRAQAISNTGEGMMAIPTGGGKGYLGTKKFEKIESIEEMRSRKKLPPISPEQQKLADARKAYTGWKTQMTDIDKMRGVKRKYDDGEEKNPQNTQENLDDQAEDQQKAA